MLKQHVTITLATLFLSGCSLEPLDTSNLPIWSSSIDIPLMSTKVTISSLINDSLITEIPIGMNGDKIFLFSKSIKLDEVLVGDNLKIDPIEREFVHHASAVTVDSSTTTFAMAFDPVTIDPVAETDTAAVGLIALDNIEPGQTSPYRFTEIMPPTLVTSLNAAIPPGGSVDVVIDTLELTPVAKEVTFDSFRTVTVSSGSLHVTILNDMFIPLGAPIFVDVFDSLEVNLFRLIWDDAIAADDSATQSKDLAGISLTGKLSIEVSGTSNGSNGDTVSVDTAALSSSFRTRVSASKIEVTHADAIVESQTITDTAFVSLTESDNIIQQGTFASGVMEISITNGLPLDGTVDLTVSSLYYQSPDSLLKIQFGLPSGGPIGLPERDLTGWTVVMDYPSQELNYHYQIVTEGTDPDFVTIDELDEIILDLSIFNPSFIEVVGEISPQTVIESGFITISSESQIQTAAIATGSMSISIENLVGGNSDVQIVVPGLKFEGSIFDTVVSISPGPNTHVISLNGYDVMPISITDQRLAYTTTTVTQSTPGVPVEYLLNETIDAVVNLTDLEFNALTGIINQAANVDEDVIELENETKVESAVVEHGALELMIQNDIGLAADVEIDIAELSLGGSPLALSFPITAAITPQLRTIDLSGYTLMLPIDDQRIHYTSTLTIQTDSLLTLTLDDSITTSFFIDTLQLSSLVGIIDTFEIEIDTLTESVTPLPTDLDGFNFANVEIEIEFDSPLTVPVLLDLTLTATSDDGLTESTTITGWNMTDSTRVVFPDSERLINIRPTSFTAFGMATVGGNASSGSVSSDQSINGILYMRAPLEMTVDENATIITDPFEVTGPEPSEQVSEEIEKVLLYVNYQNQFEFGTTMTVYMGRDTTALRDGTGTVLIDSLRLLPDFDGIDSLLLTDERLDLFNQRNMYIQAHLKILGTEDAEGRPLPSKLLSTDSLAINLSGQLHFLIDGPKLAD